MLRGIRKASSNWLGKIVMAVVMGVLIVSFAVWGIADIFKGFGQSSLAKIGKTEISIEQFSQIYTDKLQQLGRSFGRPLTSEQARAFGLDRQVLQQTIAEAALPGFEYQGWFGVIAPARLPREVMRKLNAEIVRIVALPEIQERIARDGSSAASSTPEAFDKLIREEIATRTKVFKAAGAKAN